MAFQGLCQLTPAGLLTLHLAPSPSTTAANWSEKPNINLPPTNAEHIKKSIGNVEIPVHPFRMPIHLNNAHVCITTQNAPAFKHVKK